MKVKSDSHRRTRLTDGVSARLLIATALVVSCAGHDPAPPEFNAARTLEYISAQVAFGPRVPGSRAWQECREYLVNYFDSLGYEVTLQKFDHYDRVQDTLLHLANLIIRQPAGKSSATATSDEPVILLGAHWDSRPRSERDPDVNRQLDSLPGANDGAAGTAALMELASMFAAAPPKTRVEFVLFDAEDWGFEGDLKQYCLGSKEFARHAGGKYDFAIVLDIIAHPDARFLREGHAELYAKEVNDRVWKTAGELGVERFVDSVGMEVYDDHLPLLNARIPATDIIDMNYKHWHTTADTPDKCDSAALYDVGRVVAKVVYDYDGG